MSKNRKILVAAVLLLGAASTAAIADEFAPPAAKKWTGWHVGVQGGSAKSNYSTSLDDGREFCWTERSTTGDGFAAATCSVSSSGASASTSTTTEGAAAAGAAASGGIPEAATAGAVATNAPASASATADVDPISTSAFSSNAMGGKLTNENSDAPFAQSGLGILNVSSDFRASTGSFATANADTGVFAARSTTESNGPAGTANAIAVALFNAFDLGNGGSLDSTSYSIGGHIGYDHQLPSNVVIGFEVDASYLPNSDAKVRSDDSYALSANDIISAKRSVRLETKYIGTARVRLGYAMNNILPYVTGGLAYTQFDIDTNTELNYERLDDELGDMTLANSSSRNSRSQNAWGGVIGGGLSWMWSDTMIFSAEGLYYAFDKSVSLGPAIYGGTNQQAKLDEIVEGRVKLSIMLD